jgi:hypothetical protein
MTKSLYDQNKALLLAKYPRFAITLPDQWPAHIGSEVLYGKDVPAQQADSLLQHFNPALFILGWGSTGLVPALLENPRSNSKIMVVLVLPGEIEYFAFFMGTEAFDSVALHKIMFLTFPGLGPDELPTSMTPKDKLAFQISRTVQDVYRSFDMITTLAGTKFLFDHPLCAAAETIRKEVLPVVENTMCNRLQSLGNDIHDNWVGIKNVILNCPQINRWPRSEELLDLATTRSKSQPKTDTSAAGPAEGLVSTETDITTTFVLGSSAICLASGPSATKWLPRLTALMETDARPVLIVTDSMLGGCLKAGITPDYVCVVERFAEMVKLFEFPIPDSVTLICLPFTDPAVVAKFKKVIWWWGTDTAFDWAGLDQTLPKKMFCGRSSGTMTAAVAGVLGCQTAYLIGHDLAYADGGISHSDATPDLTRSEQARVDTLASPTAYQYGRQRLQVPKNGGGTVETSGIWNAFREDMEILIQVAPYTKFVNCNLTEGAVIAGTFPVLPTDLDKPFKPTPDLTLKAPLSSTVAARDKAFSTKLAQLAKDWDQLITFYAEAYQTVKDAKPSNVTDEAIDILSAKIAEYLNTGSRPSLADQSGPSGPGPSQGLTSNAIVFDVLLRSLTNNLLHKYYGTNLPQDGGSPGATTQAGKNWLLFQALREIIFVMAETLKKFRPELEKVTAAVAKPDPDKCGPTGASTDPAQFEIGCKGLGTSGTAP